MEGFEFITALRDEMSGPAKEMMAAIAGLTEAIQKNAEASKSVEASHKKLGESFHEVGEKAKEGKSFFKDFTESLVPEIAMGELAAEGLKKLGEGLVEGVKFAVEAGEFRENMVQAYAVIKGGVEEGEATFREIDTLAQNLHMPTERAHQLASQLMFEGLKNQDALKDTISAISNLQRVGMAEGAQRLQMVIDRSLSTGHLEVSKRTLYGTGIQIDALTADLANRLHKSVGQIKYELMKGQIDAEAGIGAITEEINKGYIGKVASQRHTVTDAVTDMKNNVRSLFQEADSGPVVEAFQSIADAIKPGTEGAQEFKDTLDGVMSLAGSLIDLVHTLGSGIGTVFGGIKDGANAVLAKFHEVGDAIRDITPGGKEFHQGAQREIDQRTDKELREAVGKKWIESHTLDTKKALGDIDKDNEEAAKLLGANIGKGIAEGLKGTLPDIRAAGFEAGKTAHEGAKAGADAHSPSRKMMQLGRDMNEGFKLGIEQSLDLAADALSKAATPPALDVRAAGQGARSVDVGGINIEIHGVSRAEEILPLIESQLTDVLERAALEAGG